MDDLALLCIHPHPDDEAIACGGLIARSVDEGVRVAVVTCTGGEAGENLAGIDLGDVPLPEHRKREMAAALAALGVDHHVWLGYRDSGMAGTADNHHADSFHGADVDEAARRLVPVIREVRPHVVVSDDEHGTYGHPDHVKAHHVTVRALALAADPDVLPDAGAAWEVAKRYSTATSRSRIVSLHRALRAAGLASPFGDDEEPTPFGIDDEAVTSRVDVGPWLERKRAAMLAHRSQIGEDSFFLNVPDGLAQDHFSLEEYRLEAGVAGQLPEDDLFAGLR